MSSWKRPHDNGSKLPLADMNHQGHENSYFGGGKFHNPLSHKKVGSHLKYPCALRFTKVEKINMVY